MQFRVNTTEGDVQLCVALFVYEYTKNGHQESKYPK